MAWDDDILSCCHYLNLRQRSGNKDTPTPGNDGGNPTCLPMVRLACASCLFVTTSICIVDICGF